MRLLLIEDAPKLGECPQQQSKRVGVPRGSGPRRSRGSAPRPKEREGQSTPSKRLDDERKVNDSDEHEAKTAAATEDVLEAFELTEQSFDLIAPALSLTLRVDTVVGSCGPGSAPKVAPDSRGERQVHRAVVRLPRSKNLLLKPWCCHRAVTHSVLDASMMRVAYTGWPPLLLELIIVYGFRVPCGRCASQSGGVIGQRCGHAIARGLLRVRRNLRHE